jgi:hypothetical protein
MGHSVAKVISRFPYSVTLSSHQPKTKNETIIDSSSFCLCMRGGGVLQNLLCNRNIFLFLVRFLLHRI